MKKINGDEVQYIARLSKLRLSEAQAQEMGNHLQTVLSYFEMLDSVDTSSVSPTAHILQNVNVLRDDVKTDTPFPREALLANAPEKSDDSYIVPRVVE